MNKVINYCHDCLEFDAAIAGCTCAVVAVQRYSLDKIDIDTDSMVVGAIAYDRVAVAVVGDDVGVGVAFVYAVAAAAAAAAADHSDGIGVVSTAEAHFAVSHVSHASHCLLYDGCCCCCCVCISFETLHCQHWQHYYYQNTKTSESKQCAVI